MPSRRILLVMAEPPLPFGNAAARWFYVLMKGLVERGHQVTAFATYSKPEEVEKSRKIFAESDYDLRYFAVRERSNLLQKVETVRRPMSHFFSDALREEFRSEAAKGYDVIHLEQLWCGWLSWEHTERTLVNVHHLVWIDLEGARAESPRQRLDFALMIKGERQLVRRFHYFRACSPRLNGPMKTVNPGADITTVPVGLDPTLYPYIPDERRSNSKTLTLIGSMGWYPGYSAAIRLLTRLWPEIKRRVPDAKLQIVGWSARSALKDYLEQPDIEIAENVPEIQPYFDRANVLLYAPARGSGMKIKILESMLFGVPVVTTSEGVEGLPAEDGVHAGVCEDDAGLIERAVELLNDPAMQDRQRRAARELVEDYCSPRRTLDAIEAIYDRMLEMKR